MKAIIIFKTISICFFIFLYTATTVSGQVQCLKDAWSHYSEGERALSDKNNSTAGSQFSLAITSCNLCITQFRNTAREMQAKEPKCPPIGSVSAADWQHINSNWALNDVATAAFIKGKSAEYLLGIDSKRYVNMQVVRDSARVLVKQLSYGRCWDAKGFFWSPCKGLLGDSECCPN